MATDPTPRFIDLSFLRCGARDPPDDMDYHIYNKRSSFVICGTDHTRWTAYSFAEKKPDQKAEDSEDDGQEDPIASGTDAYGEPYTVVPSSPFSDPREYFLVVLEVRLVEILEDWKKIVQWIASCIGDQEGYDTFNLARKAPAYKEPRSENPKQAFDRVRQMLRLLRQLLERLSKTIKAGYGFISENGDIDYFSSLASSELEEKRNFIQGSPHSIQELLKKLEQLQEELVCLQKTSDDSLEALHVRNIVETNEAAQQSRFNGQFTNWIISPLTLAFAYFSMDKSAIPFPISVKSLLVVTFVITVVYNLLHIALRLLPKLGWFTGGLRAMRMDWPTVNESYATDCVQYLPRRKRGGKVVAQIEDIELNDQDVVLEENGD